MSHARLVRGWSAGWPPLAVALSMIVAAACAPIDDVAELDVLSNRHDAAPNDDLSRGDAAEPAPDVLTTCKMQSAPCTICTTTAQCLTPWTKCLADVACLHAIPVVRSCDCDAQMFDAGSIAACGQAFQSVGPAAADLAACLVASCAAECGL
jgi:hypothetical protein